MGKTVYLFLTSAFMDVQQMSITVNNPLNQLFSQSVHQGTSNPGPQKTKQIQVVPTPNKPECRRTLAGECPGQRGTEDTGGGIPWGQNVSQDEQCVSLKVFSHKEGGINHVWVITGF